jgi:thiamine-monophosphate kinase
MAADKAPDSIPPTATVGDVGERAVVERIVRLCASPGPDPDSITVVGPGDDAAIMRCDDGRVVVSTDMAVEGQHFRRDWSSATDIGHRVAAANCADVAAMGAAPTGLVVALGLPADTEVTWVEHLIAGLVDEAARAGAVVVGGDVTAAESIVVSVCALGSMQGREPVLRSGAHAGDVVAIAGRLGWAAAGLAVLSRGFRSPRALVDAHRRPQPPYAAAVAAAQAGAHALMDVSDGLLLDAQRLARASGVEIEIDSADLVVDEPVASTAAAYNLDPLQWVLGGGDDHAFVATFAHDVVPPEPFIIIGRVVDGEEPGRVRVDGAVAEVAAGFEHFRR